MAKSYESLIQDFGLTDEHCNQKVSDDHLQQISRSCCTQWKSLPPYLEVETIVADDIDKTQKREREKRHDFLKEWRGTSDGTYKQLITALLKIKSREDAEKVCKILKQSSQPTVVPRLPPSATPNSAPALPIGAPDSAAASRSRIHADDDEICTKKNKSDEKPLYTKADQERLYQEHMPEDMPMDKDSNKYKFLYEFCQDIKYIIQTVNENEYQAANTFMKAPHDGMFSSAVIYPENSMVIGFFGKAKIKAALIQTKPGPGVDNYIEKAIEAYPNAQYVLGVGVCFAFDRSKFPFGDVIVSSSIADFTMFKVTRENGEDKLKFENRGDTSSVDKHLHKTFCLDLERGQKFEVTKGSRFSKVVSGIMISSSVLVSNQIMCDAFARGNDKAIGGEMEGGQLMKFVKKRKIEGIIIIKGVADYGNEDKASGKKWQFTAASAALHYTDLKLRNVSV